MTVSNCTNGHFFVRIIVSKWPFTKSSINSFSVIITRLKMAVTSEMKYQFVRLWSFSYHEGINVLIMNLFRRSSTGGEADSEANSGLKGSFLGRVFLPRSRTTSNCNLDRSSSVTSGLTSNLNSTSQPNNSHTNHGHSRYEMFQNTEFSALLFMYLRPHFCVQYIYWVVLFGP